MLQATQAPLLSALSDTEFTTLTHPEFPKHSVRVKRTKFCDETVQTYTGYIDVGARHLFFYFFESRNDPSTDDVILWTNGGPGSSSAIGLFMELGPCRIHGPNGTTYHEQSWNTRANVFFIDQPVGVGFSYADYGEIVTTTEEAAQDVANFVHVFFEHFTQFKGSKLHLSGESYAGRYLPIFAGYIYDQNEIMKERGVTPINLASIMIGDGWTHPLSIIETWYDMACTPATVPPILGVRACVRMKQAQGRCVEWLKRSCMDVFDDLACTAAMAFCEEELLVPTFNSGWNPYDISKKCDGNIDETLCYRDTAHIEAYLNRPDVRKLIGVDSSLDSYNFTLSSDRMVRDFVKAMDRSRSTHHYVEALLEHGVKVLIYAGKNDLMGSWLGEEKFVHLLDWSGKEGFSKAEIKAWYADPRNMSKSGDVKSYGGLSFLTIEGAGHIAPYDKPDESLWMVNQWLDNSL
ncbi:carboxypeptidase Y [Coprinopsis sp. MPI-PUGE-AT-0042]|nr:carboxypeptidase Y [Coprinopsis sp. MPI-PUGE-AT-0042]